jgi:hypothetical protein
VSESFQNLTAHYRKHFPLIGNGLKFLEQQGRPNPHGSRGVWWVGFDMDESRNQLFTQTRLDCWDDPCRREFNDLEEGIQVLQGKQTASSNSTTQGIVDGTLSREVELLKDKLGVMEGRVGDEVFVLNERSFNYFYDTKSWIVTNEIPSCGLYWDLFSILVDMGPKKHSGKERADTPYASQRTQTTIFENELAASMSHEKPSSLYGKAEGDLGEIDTGFSSCTSYEHWIGLGGRESYKGLLTKRLGTCIKSVQGALRGKRTTALALVLLYWSNPVSQVLRAMAFKTNNPRTF